MKYKTIQDIIDIDFDDISKMSKKELRSITNKLVSASNKRLRRLAKSSYGDLSPVYQKERFSTKGKSRSGVMREFANAKRFLTSQTSTVRGWNKYRTQMEERIGGKLPKNQVRKFWRVYRKFEETHYGGMQATRDGSERIQKHIREEYIDNHILDEDELLESAEEALEDYYLNQ